MKSNSDSIPQQMTMSVRKTQFAYNITEVVKEDMDGKHRMSYDYDYVEIEGGVTRDKVIDAIICTRYTKDAEIALINNELANPGTSEYVEYQAFRKFVKEVVKE